jgi:predicted acylesterase/phospholipase RssA
MRSAVSEEEMMSLRDRIDRKGQKKLLAIDGGGIRGVLSLEVLQKIESLLKEQSGNPQFVLADYFDYIAGTSTGGIIAAGLSIGMPVQGQSDPATSLQIRGRTAGQKAQGGVRRRHDIRIRQAENIAVAGHAQCNDRLAVATVEQSLRKVQ